MRNGLVLGEGAGILTIENEEHAQSRRARIYGYIQGYSLVGSSSQGDGLEDLKRCIQLALRGREDVSVDYLSGAGNSSKVLDALESKGIKEVFPNRSLQIPVSSIKSMTGEGIAFGGLRMAASLLSMENGFIPPTINYLNPDPTCDLHYVINQKLDRKLETVLHLGISPGNCFSAILAGVEWSG
jgi:3-oxoacyl-[acyl-carrier-protein] synthase II